MVKESSYILMENPMKATGQVIKLVVLEYTLIVKVHAMRENGKTILNMEKV